MQIIKINFKIILMLKFYGVTKAMKNGMMKKYFLNTKKIK